MLRCLSCFTDTCSRANAESEEADQKALQELQEIGNLRTPSSPSQALNGSVTRANIETADQGVNTKRGGSADVQQDGQQNQLQASFGRRVKPCHDDFEVNRLVRYLKQGSWAMRAMAAEELWKEAAVRPLVHVLAQHQVAPALDELGRVGLIPRLLELCVCDNTCVAHQAVQVVKVLSKSVLCCAALQAAGAPAVLKSVLAQATQADGSDGNAGKEEDATGSTPATTDGISGSIRHTASEAHSPQQQPQANSSQQQPSSNAGSSLRRRSLGSNNDCKPKGSSLRHTAPSSNNNSNLGLSTPSSNDSSSVWHTAPGSNEHSSSSLWHTAPGSKGHSSSGRHTAPSSSINNSSSLWHTALGGNEHSSSMGNTVFSSNNSSINLWHTAPGNDNNNNSSSFNVWRTARDSSNGNSSFNIGQTGSNNDNSNSNLRPTAPEGEHPAQIALERLELVLRTQQNIPSTRPKNHLQPYEVDGPAQQQLLIGTPSPCTPVPLSPNGADTDAALESTDNTPARANGVLVPDGAHPHRAAMLNGNSSGSGIGRGLPPVTKGRAQKSGKKRVAWAGVPDQQLQRPVLDQQRAPTPVAALDRQPAQTSTAALDRRPAPQPTAAHDQQPAPHQQLLQQHSTLEELQRAPGSPAAHDQRPALHQRLLQEQSTPELQKHQQQQLQPAPESKAALDRHPAPHQRLLQQQSTPAELQLQPILVPWPLQSKQSTPKEQQQQAHKKEQGKTQEQEALPAHGRESVRQQQLPQSHATQPLALFDSGPGGAQHTHNSAAAQAFIAVSDSATRSRTFEQQHKSARHGVSPTEDGRGGASGRSCAKAWLGAGELQDGIGGAQGRSGAGVPQTGVVCGNGGAEVRSGAGDQQTVLVCSNGGTPQDMRSGAGMQQPWAKGAAGVGAQNGTLRDEQEQSCSQQQQQQQQRASPLSLASFDQQQQQQLHNSKLPNVQPTHQHHEPQTAATSAASEGRALSAVDPSTPAAAGAEAGADGAARAADGVSRGAPPSQRQLNPPEQPSPAKAPTESTPSHTSPSSLSSAQPLTPLVPPITNPQLPIPLQHQQSPVPLHRQLSPLGTRPVGHPKTFMSPSTSRRSGASSELYSCDSTSTPILPMPPLPTSSTGVSPRSQPALRTSSFFSCADDVLGGGLREAADTEHGSASDTPAVLHQTKCNVALNAGLTPLCKTVKGTSSEA
ncbi:hypothetical protein DUNSADRAFT_7653 [Dunaliella salina]|uniref:Uncharacterized protein n=1 Tax=Dunaliella salina TaxID=3046 RepID=A0ABQ7H651_DUNSA|nr:hypothetical protein DUNSADRAFT_7653 [Dunaliella salina]|eukprot:KAF5842339.1 hypothetical protein DUNSADRAFT_7653 [Dunaliella salina]